MSLYFLEEICANCKYAVTHDCCKSFCRCELLGDKKELEYVLEVDYCDGTCMLKEL